MSRGEADLVPMGRRTLIQAANTVVVLLLAALALVRWGFLGFGAFPYPALLIVSGGLLNALYIRRKGSLDVAAWALIGLLLVGLFFAGLTTGGYSGPVVLLSPLIPVVAVLLISASRAWIALALVSLVLAALLYLDLAGFILPATLDPARAAIGRFVALQALCFSAVLVVWRFSRVSRGLVEEIERQSVTDYLTGVFNRRGIEAILLSEVGRARRSGNWLSVVLADVDHFKRYNDTYGHQSGDRCLVRVAQAIAASSERSTDVVGRFGGEEFIVILPDTDPAGACKVADNMRRRLQAENIECGQDDAECVSMTLGVVSARGPAIGSIEQLIRQADAALYRGKRQGRNQVVNEVLEN